MSKKPSSRTPTRTPKTAPKASSTKVSYFSNKISQCINKVRVR